MSYRPSPVPHDAPAGLKAWLARELYLIAISLRSRAGLQLDQLGAAPARPADGMIVYANGSTWDPGAGAGFYGYESGAWVKL